MTTVTTILFEITFRQTSLSFKQIVLKRPQKINAKCRSGHKMQVIALSRLSHTSVLPSSSSCRPVGVNSLMMTTTIVMTIMSVMMMMMMMMTIVVMMTLRTHDILSTPPGCTSPIFFLNSNIRSLLPARVTSVKLLCDTFKNTRMSEQLQNKCSTYSSIIIRP